jgi:hypothetical protein
MVEQADVEVTIHLPEAVELVAGDIAWHGSLDEGEARKHVLSVRALAEGD